MGLEPGLEPVPPGLEPVPLVGLKQGRPPGRGVQPSAQSLAWLPDFFFRKE